MQIVSSENEKISEHLLGGSLFPVHKDQVLVRDVSASLYVSCLAGQYPEASVTVPILPVDMAECVEWDVPPAPVIIDLVIELSCVSVFVVDRVPLLMTRLVSGMTWVFVFVADEVLLVTMILSGMPCASVFVPGEVLLITWIVSGISCGSEFVAGVVLLLT